MTTKFISDMGPKSALIAPRPLCNQLLSEFSSNQSETLQRFYKHFEDVHVTFSRQENHF